jgi:hypothetical protein
VGSAVAPLRAARPAEPAAGLDAVGVEVRRSGRMTGALLVGSSLVLLAFGTAAWTLAPTLYVRPDGTRASLQQPHPDELRLELRRTALRLAEPVTIRRR